MKVRISLVLVLFLLAFSALASSHMEPTTKSKLDPFIGRFTCKGMAFASPMGPEHATIATVETKWVLGGNFAEYTYAETKTAANPKPFTARGFFGYDGERKKYINGGVDNMGGYTAEVSDGWNGDEMVFTGPYHTGMMTLSGRDTFTKTGASVTGHVFEIEQDGKWVKLGQETCTRVK